MYASSRFLTLSVQQPKSSLSLHVLSNSTNSHNLSKRTKRAKWNLDDFLQESKLIHGDKYDYSFVTHEHIKGYTSLIPVKCVTCESIWEPSINHHINHKSGCPECAGKVKWTLGRFLQRVIVVHGNKYDYSLVTVEHIQGKDSLVPVKCLTCYYIWMPSIHAHINGKTGCPDCAGKIPWNLERFINRAVNIHGDKYDYSMITINDIQGKDAKVPIKCNTCYYIWSPSIHGHTYAKTGCPNCAGLALITLQSFLEKAKLKHGDKYDYSGATEEHINGAKSKIPVKCNTCKKTWYPCISTHINGGSGCPRCKFSKGEMECSRCLDELGLEYQIQFIIETLPNRKYDFMFIYENRKYLIEFDGQQHFEFTAFFHVNNDKFLQRQWTDVVKTNHAISTGYHIIRISHKDINEIKYHIRKAILIGESSYFSDPNYYQYILNEMQS